jgi:hypothetical protein
MTKSYRRSNSVGAGVVLASCAMTIILSSLTAWAEGPAITDIVAAQREYFARIQTLDMTYSIEHQSKVASFRNVSRVQLSGLRYRIETLLDDSTFPARSRDMGDIVAFDLDKHQIFYKKMLVLSVQTATPAWGYKDNVAILQPFEPAIPDVSQRTHEALAKDKNVWDDLVAGTKLEGQKEYAGHRCWSLSIVRQKGGHYRWFIADDLNLYPIGYENYHPSGKLAAKYEVSEVKRVTTAAGEVIIPMKATWDWFKEDGALVQREIFTVDDRGLTVNEPIPNEVFTISRSFARSFEDRDSQSASFASPKLIRPIIASGDAASNTRASVSDTGIQDNLETPPGSILAGSRKILWGSIVAVIACLSLGVLWQMRRHRSRETQLDMSQ